MQELYLFADLFPVDAHRGCFIPTLCDVHGRIDKSVVGWNVFVLVHVVVGVIDLTAAVDNIELLSPLPIMRGLSII